MAGTNKSLMNGVGVTRKSFHKLSSYWSSHSSSLQTDQAEKCIEISDSFENQRRQVVLNVKHLKKKFKLNFVGVFNIIFLLHYILF